VAPAPARLAELAAAVELAADELARALDARARAAR
jgi:hypothetical protein